MAEISPSDCSPAGSADARASRPWILTIFGLIGIVCLLALPFLNVYGDVEAMPQLAHFIGHFHPLVLHLPIGVFTLILCQELGGWLRGRKPEAGVGFTLSFGVWSAIFAVVAGYLLWRSGGADYEGNELASRHLWGGVVFTSAVIGTAVLKKWVAVMGWRPVAYRLPLLASVGVMGFTSHDGGSMTHGSDFLTKHAPDPVKRLLGVEIEQDASGEPLVYADVIGPIFERRCVACHKQGKSKGGLRMDGYEFLLKGGKEGPAIAPGDAEGSNIIVRMNLPLSDEDHMPPDGKPQIEEQELLVIKWWIEEGAKNDTRLADAEFPAEIESIVAKLVKMPRPGPQDTQTASGHGASGPSQELQSLVSDLAASYPGTLSFESQESAGVVFSAVSLRSKLGDGEFSAFSSVIPHLVSVDLTATKITDPSVAMLEQADQLQTLRLAQTGISDQAIDSVQKLVQLKSLNLYGTGVSDQGLMKLVGMPNLQRVYLWQTKVTEQGVEQFRSQMPACEVILGVD